MPEITGLAKGAAMSSEVAEKTIEQAEIERLGLALYEAERTRVPIEPLTSMYPNMTPADAYGIQQVMMAGKLKGHKILGRKVGLTSRAMQQMLGVDQPDYGLLLDDMSVLDGGDCPLDELIQPKIEPEIAFVLEKDLTGPDVTIEQVLDATAYICPSLEIVDSRIRNWQIKLADTIADNASSARYVLGSTISPVKSHDLRLMGMILEKNGQLIDTGAGAAALGHPANAVAWLANKLSEFGVSLKAGDVILPGALCRAVDCKRGDTFRADFAGIGSVSVRFI
jgi:2-oxopent-4-enoate hydratase